MSHYHCKFGCVSRSLNIFFTNFKGIKMDFDKVVVVLSTILGLVAVICFIPFLSFIVFPFFQSFSPECRIEKFVNEHCLQGNEVAILIKRERLSHYTDRDHALIRAAIEGNESAIKALKLDSVIKKTEI